jgi:hypothetical protein
VSDGSIIQAPFPGISRMIKVIIIYKGRKGRPQNDTTSRA